MNSTPRVALSEPVGDEVRKTTCYMCACRCGINVHIKDGKIRYIEGNRDHPVNRGVLCAKGSAGIMQHYAPARLRAPLKRTGPRGSGEFLEISWEEALGIATGWLDGVRQSDPKNSPSSPVATSRSRSPASGRSSSARPTTPPMAASVRSTWPQPAS